MKRLAIDLDDETHARLVEKAKGEDRSLMALIRRSLMRVAGTLSAKAGKS